MKQKKAGGLMKITAPPPPIASTREILNPQSIPPGLNNSIKAPTFYKHAVISFYGNGDSQIIVRVYFGGGYSIWVEVRGNELRTVTVANDTIQIMAENTDSSTSRTTPRIEILSLDWS
jgi:hypothetical protein